MSRYSPTVQPTAANPLEAALSAGYQGFEAARTKNREQMLNDALLASKGVYAPGVTPPEAPPTSPLADAFGSMAREQRMPARPEAPGPQPAPGAWTPETGFSGLPTTWNFGARVAPQRYVTTPGGYTVQNPDFAAAQAEQHDLDKIGLGEVIKQNDRRRARSEAFATLHQIDPNTYPAERPGIEYENLLTDALTTRRGAETSRRGAMDQARDFVGAFRDSPDPETRAQVAAMVAKYGADLAGLANASEAELGRFTMQASAARTRETRQEQQRVRTDAMQEKGRGAFDVIAQEAPTHAFAREGYKPEKAQAYINELPFIRSSAGHVKQTAPLALANMSRFTSAVPTMALANERMKPFEEIAKKNPGAFGLLDQALLEMANEKGGTFVSRESISGAFKKSAAWTGLAKKNPQLANYLVNLATWAYEDGTIQLRGGTDFRVRLDELISGIRPYLDAETIGNIQENRAARLAGYVNVMPAAWRALGTTLSGKEAQFYANSMIQSDFDTPDILAKMRGAGFSNDQIQRAIAGLAGRKR